MPYYSAVSTTLTQIKPTRPRSKNSGTQNMTTTEIRQALRAKTEKATRHQAIDNGAKKARHAQAMFIRFSCRLAARVQKQFPTATVKVEHVEHPETSRHYLVSGVGEKHPIKSTFWVVEDSRIIRSYIVVHAFADLCSVLVESLNPGGVGAGCKVMEVQPATRTDKAFNRIVKTPFGVTARAKMS